MSCGLSVEQMLAIGAALCGVVAILLVLLVVHPVSRMRHAPIMIGCCLAVMAITVVGCGAMVSPVALPRAPVALSILLLSAILGIVVALMVRHLLVRQGPPAGPADAVAAALERIAQDANCEFGTVWGDLGAQRRNALHRVQSGSAELSIPGKATLYQAIREVADELGVDRPFWLPDSDQLA